MSSTFKKRLKQLHRSRARRRQRDDAGPTGVFTADGLEDLGDLAPASNARQHDARLDVAGPEAWRQHGARHRVTERGDAFYLVRSHGPDQRHGDGRLMNAASLDPRELRAYVGDDAFCEVEPATIAFVDLETTGLSKACYPFCVGIGLWRDDSFAVYHYFMTSADDEPAMLAATAEVLAEAQAVCTFNGASFDLPMLRRRFQHHGLDHPIDELAQIDLLRVSRRLLSHRDSHKLSRLEEDVLGFERHDDVAGAKIPPRWRRYLRSGDTELLVDIFEHNRLDIISMVVLMRYFAEYDPEREHDSRGSKHRGGLSPQAPPDRPRGKLASRLARSYALRDKASRRKSADDPAPPDDSAKSERDSVKLAGSFSRSDLRQKMPVGTRLRELRRGVDRCLDQGQPHEALAMLHEMVALSPRHPFALEKLVEHYRQSGDKKLADHFAARLEESSPF